jgi:xylulokinase
LFTSDLQKYNLCTYDHAAPGMYATVAFSLTGGNLLKWFRDQFGDKEVSEAGGTGKDAYELLLGKMPSKPSRLLVLPYFTPSGTPYFDVSVKGAILGLDMSVTREEILRALLEGVAFELRLNLDILKESGYEVSELRIIGGGARSATHVQLKADVLGMPVTVLDITEAGCMGMAMLAKAFHEQRDVAGIAAEWVRPVYRAEPDISRNYDEKFADYRRLYPLLKPLYCK